MLLVLTELLDPRAASASTLKTLAARLNGHPATAYFVARLVSDGHRSLEGVLSQMEVVAAFQNRFLQEILTEAVIGRKGMQIASLLTYVPAADFDMLHEIFQDVDRKTLSAVLADLTDSCVLMYSMDRGYEIPEIVRSNILHRQSEIFYKLLERASGILGSRIATGEVEFSEIESALFSKVLLEGKIPPAFRRFVTGAVLHDLVY